MSTQQPIKRNFATGADAQLDMLELRASEQRRQLHNSVSNLRGNLRYKLDVKRNLSDYVFPVAGVAILVGLVFGYSATSVFTD